MPFFYAKKNYFHFPPSSYLYQLYPLRVITIKLTCQLLAAASSITFSRELHYLRPRVALPAAASRQLVRLI